MNLDIPQEILNEGVGTRVSWPVSSVKKLTNMEISREKFRDELVASFLPKVHEFIYAGKVPGMISSQHVLRDQVIKFNSHNTVVRGIHRGISEDGGLMIETSSGKLETFYSGEIIV
jgi:biotin-(acetyl-CoA carboxylase) ligase